MLKYLSDLSETDVISVFKEHGYEEFIHIVKEKNLNGTKILKILEFEIIRWNLPLNSRKKLWMFIKKLQNESNVSINLSPKPLSLDNSTRQKFENIFINKNPPQIHNNININNNNNNESNNLYMSMERQTDEDKYLNKESSICTDSNLHLPVRTEIFLDHRQSEDKLNNNKKKFNNYPKIPTEKPTNIPASQRPSYYQTTSNNDQGKLKSKNLVKIQSKDKFNPKLSPLPAIPSSSQNKSIYENGCDIVHEKNKDQCLNEDNAPNLPRRLGASSLSYGYKIKVSMENSGKNNVRHVYSNDEITDDLEENNSDIQEDQSFDSTNLLSETEDRKACDQVINLNDEPFYRNTDFIGAKLLLKDLDDGAFLFRPSNNHFVTLTIKYDNKKYANIRVIRDNNNKMSFYSENENSCPKFDTLTEFIEYFSEVDDVTFNSKDGIIGIKLNKVLTDNMF